VNLYNHVSTYSRHSSCIAWTLKTGPTNCTETSVNNYKHMLRNNPEQFLPLYRACCHIHFTKRPTHAPISALLYSH
jgi:hypothetical protein